MILLNDTMYMYLVNLLFTKNKYKIAIRKIALSFSFCTFQLV